MQLLIESCQRAVQADCGLLQGARDVTASVGEASLPEFLCRHLTDALDQLQVLSSIRLGIRLL